MSDQIRDKEPRDEDENTRELSTADLAETGRPVPRRVPIESKPERAGARSGDVIGSAVPARDRSSAGTPATSAALAMEQETGPLFSGSEANQLRAQWDAIQVAFVDEPRRAVEQADHLVADTMKRLAEIFAEERHKLEHQWDKGEGVSTEDLRLALRRYRSFFARLLSI